MTLLTVSDGIRPVKGRLLSDQEIRERMGGIARVTLYRLRRDDPRFPKQIKVRDLSRTLESEFESYLELIAAEREEVA
jgi:predicted DNA-binding transcriptional regulator AlpA